MRNELTKHLLDKGRNPFEGYLTQRVYALFAKTRSFDDLAIDPLVLGVMETLLEEKEILLSAPVGICIHPGEKAQLIHRDDGKYPIPLPHREVIVNSMWALDDFTEENGATIVFPGSHKYCEEEQLDVFRAVRNGTAASQMVKAVMPKGSVLFYRGSILHGGGANSSEKPRLGVILEFCSGWVRPQENHVLAVPRQVMKTLPVRLQELLGYSVAKPFIGYVDGRSPLKCLL